jgi:hypothetical protein
VFDWLLIAELEARRTILFARAYWLPHIIIWMIVGTVALPQILH